jgi:hypothetical protein
MHIDGVDPVVTVTGDQQAAIRCLLKVMRASEVGSDIRHIVEDLLTGDRPFKLIGVANEPDEVLLVRQDVRPSVTIVEAKVGVSITPRSLGVKAG